ncbi:MULTISPECIES: tyrosine-type recombinase/integrase [unclassified Deinococcus]|uniref:tyrosine-type recombinase/integrase n=1 Tax=unclassified Deinococcus TaxID=2623546 RepID=UPI001C2FAE8C|nr:tyrosine-type recombinase/integrase [Deinococcus sp. 43]MDK2013987.1 tyrosine-type recombinase/integrase [Deinococcus sp. 43]
MTLDLFRHGPLAPSRAWVALTPEERRRRAVAAVASRDTVTLLDLLEAHHVRTHGQVSPETLRKYRLGARTWLTYATENAVNVLHPEAENTDLWVRSLEAAGKSPASVGVLLAGARALYAALRWVKGTTDNPFADTKPKKDRRRPWDKRQPYPEADLQTLLAAAPVEMRVLLRLGGIAGLRASEITSLTWGDVDLDSGTLLVRHGKGGKSRRVFTSTSLLEDLQALGPQASDQPVIGRTPESARQRLRTLCRRVSVPYLGLHALRHTAGTRLVRAGFQLQDVAEHLGHSDVQTARTYGKWADDRLREHMRQS